LDLLSLSIYSFFASFHRGIGIPVESSHIPTAKTALIKILNENLIVNLFIYTCGCIQDCVPADTRSAELTHVEYGGVHYIYLGQDTFQWRIFGITVTNIWAPKNENTFLNIKVIFKLSKNYFAYKTYLISGLVP
jgi:hypothetical protein